jgi:hypothetical protein
MVSYHTFSMAIFVLGIWVNSKGQYVETPRLSSSWGFFSEADTKTHPSLALAYRAEGKPGKANEILSKGQRIFPGESLLRELSLKK